jgi:hypothetical protein
MKNNSTHHDEILVIKFQYPSLDLHPLFRLENEVKNLIEKDNLGNYEGNEVEIDGSDAAIFMYGPDAGKMFRSIEPIIKKVSFMKDMKAFVISLGKPDRKLTG